MSVPSDRDTCSRFSPPERWFPSVLATSLAWCFSVAHSAPIDGQVTSGAGTVSQSGSTTTITQGSQNLSMTWKSFNIGRTESVNFVQPNTNAIAVNRILDTNGTQILGSLNANGKVYLVNPNGILFGTGAQVNVGSLVASTLDLSDSSLASNERSFSGTGRGSVINQGTITAADGGYVVLLGNTVSNEGTVSARLGTIAMGAGNAVTLTFQDNQLLQMRVDQSVLNSLAKNQGLLQADGGTVLMSAGAKDSLLASVVNNSGVIQARTVENRNGTIVLLGGMEAGTTEVGGTLDASAPGAGQGGFIETSAAKVKVAEGTRISTLAANGASGTWLIDPTDFTVAASGGDMTGATLSSNLGSGSVTIQSTLGASGTAGNVNINDAVSWGANTTLTLNAQNNININANITATGASGKLALLYGQSAVASGNTSDYILNGAKISLKQGFNFVTKLGSDGASNTYMVITQLGAASDYTGWSASAQTTLQGVANSTWTGTQAYYALGADIDASATASWNSGAGFYPIGAGTSNKDKFVNTFAGLGHTVTNLTVNQGANAGLFGKTQNATIRDIGLVGGSVASSSSEAGGLIGVMEGGTLKNAYATSMTVTSIGGLVGLLQSNGVISNSYASNTLTASGAGGLVGRLNGGVINNSYASGTLSGNNSGGLVGSLGGTNTITNSYASAVLTGTGGGGFLGGTGTVTVSNSYWNTTTSGKSTGYASGSKAGLTGLTSTQMQQSSSFSGWSIASTGGSSSIWRIYEGQTAPLLRSFLTSLTATAGSGSAVYDGNTNVAELGVSYSLTPGSGLNTSALTLTASSKDVGSRTVTANGLYSTQLGYDISYATGSVTITPATVTVSGATAANKTYDGTTTATISGGTLSGLVGSETLALTQSGSFSDKNVGNTKTVNETFAIGNGSNGGVASNYQLASSTGSTTANITRATVTVSGATAANKTYDGTSTATVNGGTLSGLMGSETLALTQSGSFTDKNVANGKTVNANFAIADGSNGGVASNYQLASSTGSSTANITPANLVVSGISAQNKVYDATTSATLNGTASVTPLGADTVNLTGTGVGHFLDKNVGTTKSVVVTGYSLAGTDAGNYAVVQPVGVTANISKAPLVVSGVVAADKVYDATTTAILSGGAVTALGTDALSLNTAGATGQFVNANAGLSKNVIATGYTLGGADANNYDLQQPSGVTATIGRATVTVSGATAEDKTYDGTTTATVKGGTLSGLVGAETLSLTQTGSFSDKNPGSGKTVTEYFSLGNGSNGGLASNYQLASATSTTTASIAALPDTTASTSKSRDVGNLNELAKSSIFTSRTNQVAVSPTLQTLERSTAKETTSSPADSGRGAPQTRSAVATAATSGPVLLIQDDGVNLRGDFELVVAP